MAELEKLADELNAERREKDGLAAQLSAAGDQVAITFFPVRLPLKSRKLKDFCSRVWVV